MKNESYKVLIDNAELVLEREKDYNFEEYLAKAQNGDKHALDILVLKNIKLVYKLAKKLEFVTNNVDDVFSVGVGGLINAIKKFDPTKNVPFGSFASTCIINEMLMFKRVVDKTHKYETDFECLCPQANADKDDRISSLKFIEDKASSSKFANIVDRDKAKSIINLLKTKYKVKDEYLKIIDFRFGLTSGEAHSQRETAKLLNIRRAVVVYVDQKVAKILQKEFSDCKSFLEY